MNENRTVYATDGETAVGAAVDRRTQPVSVSVWIEIPGVPTHGANLSPTSARQLAERLLAAADAAS